MEEEKTYIFLKTSMITCSESGTGPFNQIWESSGSDFAVVNFKVEIQGQDFPLTRHRQDRKALKHKLYPEIPYSNTEDFNLAIERFIERSSNLTDRNLREDKRNKLRQGEDVNFFYRKNGTIFLANGFDQNIWGISTELTPDVHESDTLIFKAKFPGTSCTLRAGLPAREVMMTQSAIQEELKSENRRDWKSLECSAHSEASTTDTENKSNEKTKRWCFCC